MALKKDLSSSRQLAAIMFTDIVGYTKLMGENEDKALKLLTRNKAIQKPLVQKYDGRWLKEIGDGTLSSFNSALDAVYCANKIMKAFKDNPDINIRIGIHIGDVTFSKGDVYGDGVNIASRLEEYAQPNEILVSEVVYHNIKNIEGIKVEFLKEVELKNVQDPVRIYRIGEEISEHDANALSIPLDEAKPAGSNLLKNVFWILGVFVILLASYFFILQKIPAFQSFDQDPPEKTMAVMLFENLGGDEGYAYSVGLTEDILFQLMKIHDLTVIQQPKSEPMNPEDNTFKDIGIKLGVAHLLLGSVWKKEEELLVTARLIDTRNGQMVWSNKWNKPFKDIFAIQSEIAISIANALEARITTEEAARISKLPTTNMTAYDLYLKGREYYSRYTERDNLNALELFTKALKLDPDFTLAHAGLSDVYSQLAQRSHIKEFWLDSAFHHAQIVKENEPAYSSGYKSLGLYYSIVGNTSKAIEEFKRAVEIDNNMEAVINLSRIYYRTGEMDKSLKILDDSRNLYPLNENILFNYGANHYRLNDFHQANEYLDDALVINPGHINSLLLKWFIATLSGIDEVSFSTSSKLGYFANDNTDQVLTQLQNHLSNKIIDLEETAKILNSYIDDRELDYVDIPYLYILIGQIYYLGGLKDKAIDMFDYKIIYNRERIDQGDLSYKFYYEIAQIYAITGQTEKAYEYLELSVDYGWPEYLYGLLDPSFSEILNEAKFQEIIEESRQKVNAIQLNLKGSEI